MPGPGRSVELPRGDQDATLGERTDGSSTILPGAGGSHPQVETRLRVVDDVSRVAQRGTQDLTTGPVRLPLRLDVSVVGQRHGHRRLDGSRHDHSRVLAHLEERRDEVRVARHEGRAVPRQAVSYTHL